MNPNLPPKMAPASSTIGGAAAFPMMSIPRGMVCLLLLGSALLASTARAVPDYLFKPGHGLTDITVGTNPATGNKFTVPELIQLCRPTGTVAPAPVMQWMKIIERQYQWIDLEPTAGDYSGVATIINEAKACKVANMYLRVRINHKFTTFPVANWGEGGILKLHTAAGAQHLEDIYTEVIRQLRLPGNEDALKGFYGFVLQETALGGGAWPQATQEAWLTNLMAFHGWLSDELKNIDTGASDDHPAGRLFWQMINSPVNYNWAIDDVVLVNNLPRGAGICGPDTVPNEPSSGGVSVYRTYNIFRTVRGVVPTSLHVFESNYHYDRPVAPSYTDPIDGNPTPIEGVTPLFSTEDLDVGYTRRDSVSNGTYNLPVTQLHNGFGGTGILNFLGCVKNVTPVAGGFMPRDSLRLNNIIWACKSGTFGGTPYGWPQVKAWMEASPGDPVVNKRFPNNVAGGCNQSAPSNILGPNFVSTDDDPGTPKVTINRNPAPVPPAGAFQ